MFRLGENPDEASPVTSSPCVFDCYWGAESPQPDDQTPAPAAPAQTAAPSDASKPADATPPAPPPKYDGFAFSALADGYFTANFNHPKSNGNQLQNFDINNNQLELSLAKVTVDKSGFGGGLPRRRRLPGRPCA